VTEPIVIAILNHKGGVAKTATASGLASAISILEPKKKILIIDADEQANLKTVFGIKLREANASLSSVLIDNINPNKAAISVRENIDIILSGGRGIREFNVKYATIPNAESLMSERFKALEGYDYVLIDCPPALSLISSNIALYATHVIIPVAPDMLSVMAAKATITFIDEMEKTYNKAPKILGVIPTMHDSRRNLDLDIVDDLERLADSNMLNGGRCFTEVRMDTKVKTAQVKRKLIHEVFPKSNAAKDYLEVGKEVLEELTKEVSPALLNSGTSAHNEARV
jgi:chromosome partitioning protein